jgi:CO dehydrogenase maturation factor
MGELVGGARDVAVADMEAGLEHLSRGTPRHADTLIAVLEPYYRSLETAARITELARELEVGHIHAVANKVRGSGDEEAIRSFCASRGIPLLAAVPYDDAVADADREGKSLLDVAPDSAAAGALRGLADRFAEAR